MNRGGWLRSGTTAHRWVAVCTVAWVALLPVNWWLSTRSGAAAGIAAGAVSAVLSAFAAVVLGAALFNRWERRLAHEREAAQRREWLSRNVMYALQCQSLMLLTLGDIAAHSYRLASPLLGSAVVPSELLRDDVVRYPSGQHAGAQGDASAELDDLVRMHAAGPLAVARSQSRRTLPRLLDLVVERVERRDHPRTEDVAAVCHAVRSAEAELLFASVDQALMLSTEVIGPQEFEPRQVRLDCLTMLRAVRGLRVESTLIAEVRGAEHPRVALEVVTQVNTLLRCVASLRLLLWENASALSSAAQGSSGSDLSQRVEAQISALSRPFKDQKWEAWRSRHETAT